VGGVAPLSFFATLKVELVHDADYAGHAPAITSIGEYIEVFYNRQRRHSHNSFESQVMFELKVQAAGKAA
jgi:hypothetical protein